MKTHAINADGTLRRLVPSESTMSRRDQVAAMCLQGLLADYSERDPDEIAEFAGRCANALLLELQKGESDE